MAKDGVESCPHCSEPLKKFTLPDNTGWQETYHLACFNDDCPYFRRGWVWMFDKFGVKSSYRHRVDPRTGATSPLPVWSRDALKDRIIEDDASNATDSSPIRPEDAAGGDQAGPHAGDGVIPENGSETGGTS